MKSKKTIFCIIILLLIINLGYSQNFQVSIVGGINSIAQYGSVDDYIAGENDFPVTPAHKTSILGLSLSYYITENFGIELSGIYNFSTKINLEDPSDGDSLQIDTANNYSVLLRVFYEKKIGKITPFIIIGGGINKITPKDQTVLSEYGYEVEFPRPEKTLDFILSVEGGIKISIVKSAGLKFGVGYNSVFSTPYRIPSFYLFGGIYLTTQ